MQIYVLSAQEPVEDSLLSIASSTNSDTVRIQVYTKLFENYLQSDVQKAIVYSKQALDVSKEYGDENFLGKHITMQDTLIFWMDKMKLHLNIT